MLWEKLCPNKYDRIFHNYTGVPSVNVPTDKLKTVFINILRWKTYKKNIWSFLNLRFGGDIMTQL